MYILPCSSGKLLLLLQRVFFLQTNFISGSGAVVSQFIKKPTQLTISNHKP